MGRTHKKRCHHCGKYHDPKQKCKAFDKSDNKANLKKFKKASKPNYYLQDIEDNWN